MIDTSFAVSVATNNRVPACRRAPGEQGFRRGMMSLQIRDFACAFFF